MIFNHDLYNRTIISALRRSGQMWRLLKLHRGWWCRMRQRRAGVPLCLCRKIRAALMLQLLRRNQSLPGGLVVWGWRCTARKKWWFEGNWISQFYIWTFPINIKEELSILFKLTSWDYLCVLCGVLTRCFFVQHLFNCYLEIIGWFLRHFWTSQTAARFS